MSLIMRDLNLFKTPFQILNIKPKEKLKYTFIYMRLIEKDISFSPMRKKNK